MSALSASRELRERIEKHQALRLQNADADVFRGRAAELRAIRESFAAVLAKARVLQVPFATLGDGTTTLAAVRDYEGRIGQETLDSGRECGRVKQALNRRLKTVSEAVEAAVQSVARGVPKYDEPFLKRVEAIPRYAERVARIRAIRDGLASSKRLDDMTAAELGPFLEKRESLLAELEELKADEFPKDVLEFFAAARRGGVQYERLTEPVKAWLSEHGLLKNIRIIVSDD